ncbi:MAG: hypothetical protein ACI865_001479 [Flavobacteriaceae bacterium]|jgi:hypothetical protein
MSLLPYNEIPSTPEQVSAPNTIARFVDGLGFRYRWATENFTQNEIDFCPVEGSMDMMQLIRHLYQLAHISNKTFGGLEELDRSLKTFDEIRLATLQNLIELSTRLKSMTDDELKICTIHLRRRNNDYAFWYVLNGPIADALTHVGQITSWRRIAGNPQPSGVDVFEGTIN